MLRVAMYLKSSPPSQKMEDLEVPLGILGQQAGLFKLYTQLCLCFQTSDTTSQRDIADTLTKGLARLAAGFRWVAGQVIKDEAGSYKIVQYQALPSLIVRDLRHDSNIPTMDALRQTYFPFRMLDEAVIAPINTLAAGAEGPAPVFLLQANFIKGGLLLTFATQHNTMDMTGMAQMMYLLSKACHDESFTAEELRTGHLDRDKLIPLLDDSYTPGPELAHQIERRAAYESTSTDQDTEPTPSPSPVCTWSYFVFPPDSLRNLKTLAMKSVTDPSSYVSTDDVLSVFIWQAVSRARLPRLEPTQKTTFARAVDPRRYLDIPATYPGLVQNMTYTVYRLDELVKQPVGIVASDLRRAVDPKTSNLGYATRALTTWFQRAEDKSDINVTATLDLSKDIMLSSWVKYNCYDLDFNLGLGKPEAVRRPQFTPVESLFYLMPKRPDGEIAAGLCLRQEDFERLRTDAEFMKYAVYVG
ncbi:hypothetical protein PV04_06268 [Phialophora macrospora]|uniref:Trichothecene 3-O-acetyltransferase-like N-terminal domain-containing protein n=1 Tax=Phialophora macrospora TaxID=1851006 RepID=A0A0D2FJS8_9EURO|nr:hypothetical protein PV04_06268 [Phialophora macrospora]